MTRSAAVGDSRLGRHPWRPNHSPGLSDEQRVELLALIKGADSVELRLTVPVADRTRGAAELGVDPLEGQIRQVYFFDTPDLSLNKQAASSFGPPRPAEG